MRKSIIGTKKFDYLVVNKINESKKRSKYLVKCTICNNVKEVYNLSESQLSHTFFSCRNTLIKNVIGEKNNDFIIVDSYYGNKRHMVDIKCLICNVLSKKIAYKDFKINKNKHGSRCTVLNTKKFKDKKLLRKLHRTYQGAKNRCTNPKCNSTSYFGRDFEFKDSTDFIVHMYPLLEDFIKNNPSIPISQVSIDRIDSNKGYKKNNVQWLSFSDNCRKH